MPLTNLPVLAATSNKGTGVSSGAGMAIVQALEGGRGRSIWPGMLDMKKPGRKKVAGMDWSRMYCSTLALESKCSTLGYWPLLSLLTFRREDQMRCWIPLS